MEKREILDFELFSSHTNEPLLICIVREFDTAQHRTIVSVQIIPLFRDKVLYQLEISPHFYKLCSWTNLSLDSVGQLIFVTSEGAREGIERLVLQTIIIPQLVESHAADIEVCDSVIPNPVHLAAKPSPPSLFSDHKNQPYRSSSAPIDFTTWKGSVSKQFQQSLKMMDIPARTLFLANLLEENLSMLCMSWEDQSALLSMLNDTVMALFKGNYLDANCLDANCQLILAETLQRFFTFRVISPVFDANAWQNFRTLSIESSFCTWLLEGRTAMAICVWRRHSAYIISRGEALEFIFKTLSELSLDTISSEVISWLTNDFFPLIAPDFRLKLVYWIVNFARRLSLEKDDSLNYERSLELLGALQKHFLLPETTSSSSHSSNNDNNDIGLFLTPATCVSEVTIIGRTARSLFIGDDRTILKEAFLLKNHLEGLLELKVSSKS